MSANLDQDWGSILSRLNALLLKSARWRVKLTPETLSAGWCGSPPALESEILEAEARLGIKLPPSYRSFLSVSNGWHPFSTFTDRLLRVQEIERLGSVRPDFVATIRKYYHADDISDEEYLDYTTPERSEAMRPQYYADSLLISEKSGVGGGELVLLNPHIIFPNGEWETIFFANWIPGNERYPSFRDFVEYNLSDEEA